MRRWFTTAGAIAMLVVASCSGSTTSSVESQRLVQTQASVEQTTPTMAPEVATGPTATAAVPTPTPIDIPPTPTPLPVERHTLLFSGDVLSHTPVIAQALAYGGTDGWAYDYRPMFADVSERVSRADLAICVLETPVSADNIGLDGYPTFEAPRELPAALLAAGYDGCSTASNHSMDRGPDGVRTTLEEMDRAGLGHAGMARSASEAGTPRLYELGEMQVAHLSYSYSLNGFILPADEPWLVNLNDVDAIVGEAERARNNGADLVVLSIQWGNEYQQAASAEQQRLAHEITRSGAVDLIVGNHVHVVQPVTTVNDVPVIYGLGNSLSNQSDNCCRTGTQDGVMIEVSLQGNADLGYAVAGLAFAPTWVDRSNYTIIDLLKELDDPELDAGLRSIYQASLERTVQAIHALGYEVPLAD